MIIAGFVLSIIGLFWNPIGIFSVLAIIMCNKKYLKEGQENLVNLATAGRVIGIVGACYTYAVLLYTIIICSSLM